ncbi:hypothetical protein NIES4074_43080 [Cylindrospermum sp. NIES-4074]|nr:hypothetical protein NIES4074_43080 [Cylindrospermum sp. NIES-4074]
MKNKVKLNALQNFLIWSAGANHEVLAREICLTERYKYESIGITVVLTSIMAFFSGGYALFTVFSSVPISIALGTVWGCTIFNLDRFFILTANQGKSASRRQFFMTSILRLSIAVLLSLVVAKPLELRLFEREINQELQEVEVERKREARRKQQEEWENSGESKRINEINAEIQYLTEEETLRSSELYKATSDVIQEVEGSSGTGKPGRGSIYKEKDELRQELEQKIKILRNRIQELGGEKKNLINRRVSRLGEAVTRLNISPQQQLERNITTTGSLLERLSALEKLSKRDPTVASTNGLITLLFIIIEISPILVKMLSKQGLYEEILEKEDKYKTSKENLRKIKEKEIFKLEELKDLELRAEALIIEYFRVKERNKEKLENIGIDDIQRINKQYDQENTKFIQICRDKLEHYKYLADEVLGSDID